MHGNKAFPFCSSRCKSVDLGNWLAEDYVVSRPIDPERDGPAIVAGLEEETN